MAFEPSPEADGARFGVAIEREPYALGDAGPESLVVKIARRIREGGRSPGMQQFANAIILAAGYSPSQPLTNQQIAQTLLDFVRAKVRYRPDPPGIEFTKGAAITLCVPGAAMCIPVGDCDDLLVALGSLLMAYGISVRILRQTFSGTDQEHVLVEFLDESGNWIAADPSVQNRPVGWKASAAEEFSIDPLDVQQLGIAGRVPEVEFIGVGRPRDVVQTKDGRWRERTMAGLFVHDGSGWKAVGAAPSFALPGYKVVTDGNIHAGLRYRIQLLFATSDLVGTMDQTRQYLEDQLQAQWLVESLDPDGDIVGLDQTWTLQGVARQDGRVVDGDPSLLNASVTNVTVQSSAANPAPSPTPAPTPPPGTPPPAPGLGVGAVIGIAAGVAVVTGLGVAWWRSRPPVSSTSRMQRRAA